MKFAISACLMGKNTKYNGKNNLNEKLVSFLKDKDYILICPEVMGGLSTPRYPSERKKDKVINSNKEDVTNNFIKGADIAIKLIKDVDVIIVKSNSPSCGKGMIYDGTFSGKLIEGNGVFVDKISITKKYIFTENEIEKIIDLYQQKIGNGK